MAHRKRKGEESGVCREPKPWLEGCSSILGLWHKKLLEREKQRANEDLLIAAGFLAAREPPAPPPPPPERKPFAEWAKKHQA